LTTPLNKVILGPYSVGSIWRVVQSERLDAGIECGVLDKKGAWLQFDGALIGQGREAAKKALEEKPELAKKIVALIMEKRAAVAVAESAKK
jgi:hypothetical protein